MRARMTAIRTAPRATTAPATTAAVHPSIPAEAATVAVVEAGVTKSRTGRYDDFESPITNSILAANFIQDEKVETASGGLNGSASQFNLPCALFTQEAK